MPDQQNDRTTLPRALNRLRGQRLSRAEREGAQELFLDAFRFNANVTASCMKAHINRSTFYQWLEHDAKFTVLYHQAEEAARDMLLAAAWQRAVNGVEKHVISMGRQVFEEIPQFHADGSPQLDSRSKPIVKFGKPLIEREYSDTILLRLMTWRIPGFRENSHIDVTTQGSTQDMQALHAAIAAALGPYPEARIALADALDEAEKTRGRS